ncbi:MAG TPA: hypothetical protein EYG11_08655 [Candidatus Latescibacteria bacterium]|nr:hypothetical protein [Candidatus Handelsmanbacteria bacterium]HIL08756.1 hypothetical protein [Candidatus Latescibacterota bacterium]
MNGVEIRVCKTTVEYCGLFCFAAFVSLLLWLDEALLVRPFCSLSGSERTCALIVALFLRRDCFALIDEPLNYLDLASWRIDRKSGVGI